MVYHKKLLGGPYKKQLWLLRTSQSMLCRDGDDAGIVRHLPDSRHILEHTNESGEAGSHIKSQRVGRSSVRAGDRGSVRGLPGALGSSPTSIHSENGGFQDARRRAKCTEREDSTIQRQIW